MVKKILKTSWAFALLSTLLFVACNDEDSALQTTDTVSAYVDESLFRLQETGNLGRFGCYELVFPVTIEFADETTETVDDYDALATAIQEWKEANPDIWGRPSFTFPIEVLSEEGALISVTNQEELWELKRECGRGFFVNRPHHGHHGNCTPCFELVFPITILFPDETTGEAESREALKALIRDWKEANPDATEKPELVFPIEVTLEDGTSVTVNSSEELQDLRENCN